MSLPHLLKHVYNNATDEVIRRGKKIHSLGTVELMEHNELMSNIGFRIKDDMYNSWYKVKIDNYTTPGGMLLRCTCPYNLTSVCRHKVASLLQLQDMADRGMLNGEHIQYNQQHTQVKIKTIDPKLLKMLCGTKIYEEADNILRVSKATILKAENELVEAELNINGESYPLRIRKNDERYFDTSCTCKERGHVVCVHKAVLFLQLLNQYGGNYFDTIRNVDRDKDKLLSLYGYSLKDNLDGKFEFVLKDGRPFLRVLDPEIKRIGSPTQTPQLKTNYSFNTAEPAVEAAPKLPSKKLGIVFKESEAVYPFFTIHAIEADRIEAPSTVEAVRWPYRNVGS
jgi:hypothetical protein